MILLAAAAIASAACQKEAQAPQETTSKATIEKTFTVTMPQDETKTYLDGMSVKWSDNDEINVIAATSGNQYTFTIASGQNTTTATFTGTLDEADASETTFYAVYPNRQIRITGDSNNRDLEHGVITLEAISTAQEAVQDAYDPQFAVMTAKTDAASATMDFRHGVAYFKIKVGIDNVNKIKISTDGSARFNGRPCLDAETGAPVNVDGAKNFVEIAPKSGDFVKGGTYFVPVTIKNSTEFIYQRPVAVRIGHIGIGLQLVSTICIADFGQGVDFYYFYSTITHNGKREGFLTTILFIIASSTYPLNLDNTRR